MNTPVLDTSDGPVGAVGREEGSRLVRVRRPVIGFHVTMRLDDERPIAVTPIARRAVARIFLKQGESRGAPRV